MNAPNYINPAPAQVRLPQYNPGVVQQPNGIVRGDLSAYGVKNLGGGDSAGGIIPRFFMLSVYQPAESARQGRPIYKDKEAISHLLPGDRHSVATNFVTDEHRQRFPEAYRAFKAGEDMVINGTALAGWPQITNAQVAELAAFNVHTVEALADLSDTQAQALGMSGETLRTRAKAYIDAAKGGAMAAQMAKERDEFKAQVELQNRQMAEMMAQMQALTARVNVSAGLAQQQPEDFDEPQPAVPELQPEARPRGRPRTVNV